MRLHKFGILLAILYSSIAGATATLKIEKLFNNEIFKKGHTTLFLNNGEVVHLDSNNRELSQKAIKAYLSNSIINIEKFKSPSKKSHKAAILNSITFKDETRSVKRKSRKKSSLSLFNDFGIDPLDHGNLTTLESYQAAQSLMNSFNGETSEKSQCYNRAHMWTYETAVESKKNLGKLWIYFTHKYIREFDYKWWFHVSPFAEVSSSSKYVLDRGFTTVPYTVENWKNLFIKNKVNCPILTDYLEYENNQEAEYCYLIYSSQYFWQPYQLKNFSMRGTLQTKYNESDLKLTYNDALISWDGDIPGYQTDANTEGTGSEDNSENSTDTTAETPTNTAPIPPRDTTNYPSLWVKIGDNIINSNGYEGYVTRILNSLKVEVRFRNSSRSVGVNTQYLARTFGRSLTGFTVGDRVRSRYGVVGRVSGVFQDGALAVKYRNSQKHIWQSASDLTRL